MKDRLDKKVIFTTFLMLSVASLACIYTLPPEAANPTNNCDSIGAILDHPERSLGKNVEVRGTASTDVGSLHTVTGADGRKILFYDNEFLSSENFQGQYVSAKGTVIATKTGQVMISGFVYSTFAPEETCLPDNDGVLK